MNFLKINKKLLDLKKAQEIFNNLVPEFVQDKMVSGSGGVSVDYEIVTVLFCDFVAFDNMVANNSPKDLIGLLDRIYNLFDQLCDLHGVQKIETVGKTYMAAGGLKDMEKNVDSNHLANHHAIRIFELGLDMIDIIQKTTMENGDLIKVNKLFYLTN